MIQGPGSACETAAPRRSRLNPTVLLMFTLLGIAIVGSIAASVLAIIGADPELPGEYHWEGAQFDRDVARAQRAVDLRVRASLEITPARTCRVRLELDGARPRGLSLILVHATQPALDQRLELVARDGMYEAACAPLAPAHYHVQLGDAAGTWSVRRELLGPQTHAVLVARPLGS